jgi:DNA mismatch repair ATPase MutS
MRGTNSAERQEATRRIVLRLSAQGSFGAIATHDLALAEDPSLASIATLAHFQETIEDGADGAQMRFDYRMREGVATSTNALRLVRLMGLDS